MLLKYFTSQVSLAALKHLRFIVYGYMLSKFDHRVYFYINEPLTATSVSLEM